jgi:hypothetical protein
VLAAADFPATAMHFGLISSLPVVILEATAGRAFAGAATLVHFVSTRR